MKRVTAGAILIALVQSSAVAWAEPLPAARPEQVGLSSERLERIARWLKADVDNGQIPGAVVLASCPQGPRGVLRELRLQGQSKRRANAEGRDLSDLLDDEADHVGGGDDPVEEGKVVLTDPLSKFIPLLKALEVSVQRSDPNTGNAIYSTVRAEREITVQDLLRHTSGFTYAFSTSNVPVKDAYTKGALFQPDSPHAYRDLPNRFARTRRRASPSG